MLHTVQGNRLGQSALQRILAYIRQRGEASRARKPAPPKNGALHHARQAVRKRASVLARSGGSELARKIKARNSRHVDCLR